MQTDKNTGIRMDTRIKQAHAGQKQELAGAAKGKPGAGTDMAVLSDIAEGLPDARRQLEDIPDIRTAKVAVLKRQVQSGTYRIRAEETAARLIRESLINDGFE